MDNLHISSHNPNFVTVFVNVRAIFAVIRSLVLYPSEARHIDFVAGVQFFIGSGAEFLAGACPVESWSSEATGVSIGPVFGSGCSSWGASCCGIVLFSFSASVAGSSISATVASLALTAVSAAGTGVSSTALPCGHKAARRATHAAIMVAMTNFFISLPPLQIRNEPPIPLPFGRRLSARFRSDSILRRVSTPVQIQR